jgi:hypothetical protein
MAAQHGGWVVCVEQPVIAMRWLGIGGAWLGCAGGAVGAPLPRVPFLLRRLLIAG